MLNGLGHLPSVMLIDSREYVDINQYLIFKHTWCLLSNKDRIASPISLWQIEIPKCLDYIACFSLFSYPCKTKPNRNQTFIIMLLHSFLLILKLSCHIPLISQVLVDLVIFLLRWYTCALVSVSSNIHTKVHVNMLASRYIIPRV
jgi:hypothetical protein